MSDNNSQTVGEYIASSLVSTNKTGNATSDYDRIGKQGARLVYSTKGVAATIDFMLDAREVTKTAYSDVEVQTNGVSVNCALFVDNYTLATNRTKTFEIVADTLNGL